MVVAFSFGLAGLTQVVVGSETVELLKTIGGLIIGMVVSILFYMEQSRVIHPKSNEQVEVELLSQAGQGLKAEHKPANTTAQLKGCNMNEAPADEGEAGKTELDK